MTIVHGFFLLCLLIIIARLLELQVLRSSEYAALAQEQHFAGVKLPAKRGEILSRSSRSEETHMLATNTTLDLLYVDPFITDDPAFVADTLAEILLTESFHRDCSEGKSTCPRELVEFYSDAFDPLLQWRRAQTGGLLLEPIPSSFIPPQVAEQYDQAEVRRLFARSIERRISEKHLLYVPLLYGANKVQMQQVQELGLQGITVDREQKLIYANPEEVPQASLSSYARKLAEPLQIDIVNLRLMLRSRPLRYVPIMRRLPPELSLKVKETILASLQKTQEKRQAASTREEAQKILDPLRSVALLQEHWRFYPDSTLASHVVGFLNTNQEAQYGIERTFNPQLRGQEGSISTVRDPEGGQILTPEQRIITPKDGDTVILTIDSSVQKEVETIMQRALRDFKADSGQAIVMEPYTGRIIAMVNVPLFDSNDYAVVYEKEPIFLTTEEEKQLVVEVYDPKTNARIVRDYKDGILTPEGRSALTEKTRKTLEELETLYDLRDLIRYYRYISDYNRFEVFPTEHPHVWLKYKNTIGVGAYLNRTVQAITEPGSVMKPITMSIAIDQGELTPTSVYDDNADVHVDEFTIRNALLIHYGKVTMTNCLEFSINTCMTSVGAKLGKKLFHRFLEHFGFGRITGIELEDELPGDLAPWKDWSSAQLATVAFGQGISVTPLQMITAYTALANGGKLMKPTIIDRIQHVDGTEEVTTPHIIEQVIKPETSATITAMLVSSVEKGYAKPAKVKGYKIAGKTGTSQIAAGQKYETGTGSTIASFVGYAPADHPRFLALIKFDRPKSVIHGATAAAPVFHEIAEFLLKYYGIPPDPDEQRP